MSFHFNNLDDITRKYMIMELELDLNQATLFFSKRFNEKGEKFYPNAIREAIQYYDESWLSQQLKINNCFKSHEQRRGKQGNVTLVKIPENASETFSEGEFNRFYCRGLCLRAIEEGKIELTIYRGKNVINPRIESEVMIGKKVSPEKLLEDLRNSQGVEPALGFPPGPNSGLTLSM